MGGDKTFVQTEVIYLPVDQIQKLLTDSVNKAMSECSGVCPIPVKAREEISHAFGMIQDVGEGSIRTGVETIRSNHQFTSVVRKTVNKVANKVFITLVLLTLSGLGGVFYLGFKTWVKSHG
jgi:hypothetical protein